MPSIHVCSLARLESTVARSGASHLVTIVDKGTPVRRPQSIRADRHLFLGFNDVTMPMEGMLLPAAHHIERLLGFLGAWDRERPIVVHCHAGISRSTAAAFIGLCAIAPDRDEGEIAWGIRRSSPTAFPNPLMVALADGILGRKGRMSAAVAAIGRGVDAFESVPFVLPIKGS